MADYSSSKKILTDVYPVISNETSNLFGRVEGLITPEELKRKFLKGIDLSDYTDNDLKNEIEFAINEFELESRLFVNKVQFKERIPFDRNLYHKYVYIKTQHGPIVSIEDLSIVSSNGEVVYKLPTSWIETGQAHRRQINLIPILTLWGASATSSAGEPSNAGLIFIQAVSAFKWMPAFWTLTYTCGLSHIDGQVPKIINDVIGMAATIEILSVKQNQIRHTSTSISQDGISQSASGPGPQTYRARIEMLMAKRDKLLSQIKATFSSKYYLSNI